MKKLTIAALIGASILQATPANAQELERWSCTWYAAGAGEWLTIEYGISSENIYEVGEDVNEIYDLVTRSDRVVVGVQAILENTVNGDSETGTLFVAVLALDKLTGELRETDTSFDIPEEETNVYTKRCVRKNG